MKKWFLLIVVLTSRNVYCQDLLYLDNDTKIQAKILEITDSIIRYKKTSYLDGPTYLLKKSEVTLIVYANGEHEIIKKTETKNELDPNKLFIQEYWRRKDSIEKQKIDSRKAKLDLFTKKQNIVFCNLIEFANIGIGIDLIREIYQQRILLYSTLSLSVGELNTEERALYGFNSYVVGNFQQKKRPVLGGLGILVSTGKRKFLNFNVGPVIKFGQYNGTYNSYTHTKIMIDSTKNIFYYEREELPHSFVANKFMVQLQANLLFRFSKKINLMIHYSANVFETTFFISGKPTTYSTITNSNWALYSPQLGLEIGYRFDWKRKKV